MRAKLVGKITSVTVGFPYAVTFLQTNFKRAGTLILYLKHYEQIKAPLDKLM